MATIPQSEKDKYNYNAIRALLISQGMPDASATFAAAQVMYETAGLKSRVSKQDNNLSGIVFINKPYQKATRGLPRPKKEGGYYAHYASVKDWAKDFLRVLSFGARPRDARDLTDYVLRLKKNFYFADPVDKYLRGVKVWLDKVGQSIPQNSTTRVDQDGNIITQQPYNIDEPKDKSDNFLNKLFDERFADERAAAWGKFGLIAGCTVVGLILITRR